MQAVQKQVAESLLMALCGFRGFPFNRGDGPLEPFARALAESTVSVEHARAVVDSFDEAFPTVREIRDVANNLRPKFEPDPDNIAQWEKQYGKPQPFTVDFTPNPGSEKEQLAMCAAIAKKIQSGRTPGKAYRDLKFSWAEWLGAKKELGYELNRYEAAMLEGRSAAELSRMR